MHLSQATFDELRAAIHRLCGLVIPPDKAYLVRHRLEPVAHAHGCATFRDFGIKLRTCASTALHDAIIEAITTSETSFFRDGHPFEAFRLHILPRLAEVARRRQTPARIWCAAASTGQEPYSVAMLVHDYIGANRGRGVKESDFTILATDISAKVLATAAAGEYQERDLARGLTPQQIQRYFQKNSNAWVLQDKIRKLVEFRRVNLVQPLLGLGIFDLIFCRNVLIYFDDATRQQICRHLADMLTAEGYLILGSAENLYGVSDRFESITFGSTLVYRKHAGGGGTPP
jgi:chemotaxis protein methyltransferase CheR